jgi:hypothetical protein
LESRPSLYFGLSPTELSSKSEKLAMSLRKSLAASLLGWGAFLYWQSTFTQTVSSAPSAPSAPASPLAPAAPALPSTVKVTPIDADAAALVDRAVARLEKASWLSTHVRQGSRVSRDTWTAEGSLRRGPNGCANLELALNRGTGGKARYRVISDGRVVAHEFTMADGKPRVSGVGLPQEPALREQQLIQLGCGGPLALLRRLRADASAWSAGSLESEAGRFVVASATVAGDPLMGPGITNVRILFDRDTSWPARVEWRSAADAPILYEVDFTDPHIDEPLSLAECNRLFSYRAE